MYYSCILSFVSDGPFNSLRAVLQIKLNIGYSGFIVDCIVLVRTSTLDLFDVCPRAAALL